MARPPLRERIDPRSVLSGQADRLLIASWRDRLVIAAASELEQRNSKTAMATNPPMVGQRWRSLFRKFVRFYPFSWGSAAKPDRLLIPSEVETIKSDAFGSHLAVREVVFASNGRCRIINGFCSFPSRVRIAIPSSVEIIGSETLAGCEQWTEVIFEADSHLRAIRGFRQCKSLSRIDIPL
jgi:hypothetical protein